MATTTKSPRTVAITALHLGRRTLPNYTHRCSPRTYTQPQLFACLVLKTFHRTDYRGIVAILKDHRELCNDLGLKRIPHFTTLQKASQRLLHSQTVHRMLAKTVTLWQSDNQSPQLVAVDASGFEAGQVSPYFVRRRQRAQKSLKNKLYQTTTYTRFPKLNLIGDCRNHLVMACHPTRGPSPDGPDLPRMMRRLPSIETIDQLLADAGYDGEHHHEMLRENYQIESLIPPRIGRPTSKPPSGRYRRLMKQLFEKPEQTNYGQRWQVETIFSMIKRNLNHAIHARTYHSQGRELMLLAVTHNVMVLIMKKVFYGADLSRFLFRFLFQGFSTEQTCPVFCLRAFF